ncbi:Glyoxylate reductase [Komagataella phaffii CBS 7435]|uniref:Glyoxylate reductase n=2 Tax=Komagataella phaffii TaxID=460519 RepID=C4R8C8_KOMPG|nr:Glyoxylate reductase [Komagataella phaffii GS115]AOA65335.1 GQ67_04965T0 [Komagataella phaffii]CAH2450752.1 Glyoxylate reductase [Komagataella phaffii CBS 7435]AOA70276.1 GQ68_04946T0 [Komagataella phaffii GS115]CAY71853.1 Glyoxylate reductase [Komagataella phaffii GS115]CCA40546.1 Glyoxylate reductase [Komagataella phaffii CBS 7435]
MTEKPKVLNLGPVRYASDAWKKLEEIADVVYTDATNRDEFIQELKSGKFDGVVAIAKTAASTRITGRLDAELIQYLPKSLRSVSNNGAGYDTIDAVPLGERRIQLSNVPRIVDAATADTHVFLLLSAIRNFQWGHDLMLKGQWVPGNKAAGAPDGHDPAGKVVGIYGMGGIGRAIRDRLKPFGFKKITYYNRKRLDPDLEDGAEYVDLDTLLRESDIISVNIPLNKHTRHALNKETIAKTKKGVVIVNTARGAIIDEEALFEALKSGHIGAVGSDVFEFEPKVSQELLELPNLVSLPHMGTHTYETSLHMEEHVVDNIRNVLEKGKVLSLVPEHVDLEFDTTPIIK